MKTELRTISGKNYHGVVCPECGVWVPVEQFSEKSNPRHAKCLDYQRTASVRRNAENRILGRSSRSRVVG